MSVFSNEDKQQVLLYVTKNLLHQNSEENEEKWQELGQEMNRDWKEIRNAYNQWKIDDASYNVIKMENEQQNIEVINAADNFQLNNFNLENGEIFTCEDEIKYVDINGELFEMNDVEQYISHDIQANTLANINCNNEDAITIGKRQLNLNDFDLELIQTLERQTQKELEMKKTEHEKKMKIYNMQLEYGEVIHKEKMKILKAKLIALQQQISHIDHVICGSSLKKRFKSGPI